MGTNWLEAAEVLSEWKVSKINLVAAVRAGELIAYDRQTFEPVNWAKVSTHLLGKRIDIIKY